MLGASLRGRECTVFDVLRATEFVTPALEILDARVLRLATHQRPVRGRSHREGFPLRHSEATSNGTSPSSTAIVDVDGVFVELALARPSEQVLVIGPDRYVMAACQADEFEGVTRQIWQLVGRNSGHPLEHSPTS